MIKNTTNLQDSFLNHVRKEGRNILCVLTSGAQLEGVVTGFDNFTVVMRTAEDRHLIYKHAIAQLISKRGDETAEQTLDEGDSENATSDSRRSKEKDPTRKPRPATAEPDSGETRPDGRFNKLDLSGIQLAAGKSNDTP